MEFGNDFIRQQEVAVLRGFVFQRACSLGKTAKRASHITDEVMEQANTTFGQLEPVEELVSKLTDYYCLAPDEVTAFPTFSTKILESL